MMVVKKESMGEIIYREIPDFKPSKGIRNCIILYGGKRKDYIEVKITQKEWDIHFNIPTPYGHGGTIA